MPMLFIFGWVFCSLFCFFSCLLALIAKGFGDWWVFRSGSMLHHWDFQAFGNNKAWCLVKLKFSWICKFGLATSIAESSSRVLRTCLVSWRTSGVALLTGVDCTWADGICSSNWCGVCLGLWSLLEF